MQVGQWKTSPLRFVKTRTLRSQTPSLSRHADHLFRVLKGESVGRQDFLTVNADKLAAGESVNLFGFDHPDQAHTSKSQGTRVVCKRPVAENGKEFEVFVIGGRSEQTGQKSQYERETQTGLCTTVSWCALPWILRDRRTRQDLALPSARHCPHCGKLGHIGAERRLLLHCASRCCAQLDRIVLARLPLWLPRLVLRICQRPAFRCCQSGRSASEDKLLPQPA